MGRGIFLVDIVDIMGCHQRNIQLGTYRDETLVYLLQLRHGMP